MDVIERVMQELGEQPLYNSYWLVENAQVFHPEVRFGEIKEPNRPLIYPSFIVDEWYQIFVNVIKIEMILPPERIWRGSIQYSKFEPETEGISWIGSFQGEIPAYPGLSKIDGTGDDLFLERNEVELLLSDCLKLKETADNQIALVGLRKLILICKTAKRMKMALYFISR